MRTAATSYAQRENNTERYMTTEEFENEAELVRPILVATAAHMLGSDSEAEDAAQETLAKLWGMRGASCAVRWRLWHAPLSETFVLTP